ncbi:MAG TPA: hypothetical protein VFS91_05190 [Nitrobacter sp.]|nr:hypothetical protein [Nitrobacter sp.]
MGMKPLAYCLLLLLPVLSLAGGVAGAVETRCWMTRAANVMQGL